MGHYVVINEWACSGFMEDCGVNIVGVAHSLEEAKSLFNSVVTIEKDLAVENDYEIYEDEDTIFDAGEEGYYVSNHTKLYIQKVK